MLFRSNPFEFISLLNKVSTDYIIIESNETVENNIPTIHFRRANMVNDENMETPYHGYATYIGSEALKFIMNEYGWGWRRIYPAELSVGIDPYRTKTKFHDSLPEHVHRYIYIFNRKQTKKNHLEHLVRQDNVGI